jgi:hypothetical protein
VCECVWMCVNVCECVWMCVNVCECVWMCVYVCECVWICVNLCESVWMYTFIHTSIFCVWVGLHMYVCIHTHTHTYIYVSVWMCVNVCKCAWTTVNVCECIHSYTQTYTHICAYKYINIYACVFVCMNVYTDVCIYMYRETETERDTMGTVLISRFFLLLHHERYELIQKYNCFNLSGTYLFKITSPVGLGLRVFLPNTIRPTDIWSTRVVLVDVLSNSRFDQSSVDQTLCWQNVCRTNGFRSRDVKPGFEGPTICQPPYEIMLQGLIQ